MNEWIVCLKKRVDLCFNTFRDRHSRFPRESSGFIIYSWLHFNLSLHSIVFPRCKCFAFFFNNIPFNRLLLLFHSYLTKKNWFFFYLNFQKTCKFLNENNFCNFFKLIDPIQRNNDLLPVKGEIICLKKTYISCRFAWTIYMGGSLF